MSTIEERIKEEKCTICGLYSDRCVCHMTTYLLGLSRFNLKPCEYPSEYPSGYHCGIETLRRYNGDGAQTPICDGHIMKLINEGWPQGGAKN